MPVKIVHPGCRIELHDRPMLAAEVMMRNPKCFVTHPQVFHEPWAIVAPDGVLTPGEKYYVVPMNTIRKLQRHHLRRSPPSSSSPLRRVHASTSPIISPLRPRVHTNQTPRRDRLASPSYNCFKKVGDGNEPGTMSKGSFFQCLLRGVKSKPREISDQSTRTESSELKELNKNMGSKNEQRQMKSVLVTTVSDNWQPSLERINEEHSC